MSTNLLDRVEELLEQCGASEHYAVSVPRSPSSADLFLIPTNGRGTRIDGRRDLRGSLSELGTIEAVRGADGERTSVRVWDPVLEDAGARLENGDDRTLRRADPKAPPHVVIDFCNPNATKALHIGHLRNISIGNSLARLFEAGGAMVVTHSHIGDIGRSMGEALAGYLLLRDARANGAKSDHMIGRCYSEYVRMQATPTAVVDPALTREGQLQDDLPEQLLAKVRDGDIDVRAIWRNVRGFVTDGHDHTLARMGVSIDLLFFESDYIRSYDEFAGRAESLGLAVRTEDGALIHETGYPEQPHLMLRRPDDFPTQYLRFLSIWEAKRLGEAFSVEVIGDEWEPLARFGPDLTTRLDADQPVHPSHFLTHGMVNLDGDAIASSTGGGLLADDLLDELESDPRLVALAQSNDRIDISRLTALVAMGWFLGRDVQKPMRFREGCLTDLGENPGWAVAAALTDAWRPEYDARAGCRDRSAYRFAVVRSELHVRMASLAREKLSPPVLMRLHGHLARWYLSAWEDPALARVVRTVLGEGVRSLGLPPPVA